MPGRAIGVRAGGSKRSLGFGFCEPDQRLPGSDVVTEVADVSGFDHTRSVSTAGGDCAGSPVPLLRQFSGSPVRRRWDQPTFFI